MSSCPCDPTHLAPEPDIAAGLSALPRQLAGFPEYRRALLGDLAQHPPLAQWRAREGDDLGLMLLEMWAYVLDVVGFYDERLAEESYLRTAKRRPSLRKLVGLLGYRPRPALAASAVVAALADGKQPLTAPAGTGLRSEAFGEEKPQVFESAADLTLDPKRNRFTVAPVRRDVFEGEDLLLETSSAGLVRGQLVVVRRPWVPAEAARVTAVEPVEALDGVTYTRVKLFPQPVPAGAKLAEVELSTPSLEAATHPMLTGPARSPFDELTLDGLYARIRAHDYVVVQRGASFQAAWVSEVQVHDVVLGEEVLGTVPTAPATRLTLFPPLPNAWRHHLGSITVHFNLVEAGRLTRAAETRLGRDELDGAAIDGPAEPLDNPPAELLLRDAEGRGVHVEGAVQIAADGVATLKIDTQEELPHALRAPVEVFANLLPVTRGESASEVLGSGDASQVFESFALKKSPLTYLNDPSAPEGRRSTLEVRVDGVRWREVPSFFGAGPEDEVCVVRQDDAGDSTVTFGDGVRGARLPSGGSVSATYRFGAGGAKPPAGTIKQLARPVRGLRRVENPVAAGGGADADRPEDLRENAPVSALTLGRAISPADFEALAREYGGVVQARADWAWDERFQRAVVKVWFISDGGDIADGLTAFLRGQADPALPVSAVEATAVATKLVIDLDVDADHRSDDVESAVAAALADPQDGLLSPANVPIGGPLFRSALFEAVHAVPGVTTVRAMTVDGKDAPAAIRTAAGRYRNYLPDLVVGNTAAGDELFAAAQVGITVNLIAFPFKVMTSEAV